MKLNSFYKKYSSWAGLLFSIPAILFIVLHSYTDMWLLYTGNLLFSAIVLTGVIRVNHLVHDNASLPSLAMVGIKITFYALLIASILSLLMLFITSLLFTRETVLNESPANAGADPRGDLVISLFVSAVMVNAVLGGLAAVVGAAVAKRNQKTVQGKTL
jgi:hypothetical protein